MRTSCALGGCTSIVSMLRSFPASHATAAYILYKRLFFLVVFECVTNLASDRLLIAEVSQLGAQRRWGNAVSMKLRTYLSYSRCHSADSMGFYKVISELRQTTLMDVRKGYLRIEGAAGVAKYWT